MGRCVLMVSVNVGSFAIIPKTFLSQMLFGASPEIGIPVLPGHCYPFDPECYSASYLSHNSDVPLFFVFLPLDRSTSIRITSHDCCLSPYAVFFLKSPARPATARMIIRTINITAPAAIIVMCVAVQKPVGSVSVK